MDDKILWDIIDGLRDEINIASDGINDLNDVVKELQAENDRLVEQVSSICGNSSSTHTHTIKKEIAEYMSHNDIDKAYIFVVDADAVDEDGYIADSHTVSTIQDSNCVSIV